MITNVCIYVSRFQYGHGKYDHHKYCIAFKHTLAKYNLTCYIGQQATKKYYYYYCSQFYQHNISAMFSLSLELSLKPCKLLYQMWWGFWGMVWFSNDRRGVCKTYLVRNIVRSMQLSLWLQSHVLKETMFSHPFLWYYTPQASKLASYPIIFISLFYSSLPC